MEVLDGEEERLVLAESVDQPQQRLEQPRLRRGIRSVGPARHRAELGEKDRELGPDWGGELVEDRVVCAREGTQRGDERGVGQLALAQLDAVPGEDARAPGRGARFQLGEQAGLSDARVTRYEGERRALRGRVGESGL